jgi:chemotaxis protein CheD
VIASRARRIVIGIGELAVTDHPGDVIVTHALGSCIAVCVWDPVVRVGGMLHFLLPDSRINPARAASQPDAFGDIGIPRLFQAAYAHGLEKGRAVVRLVGGAEIASNGSGTINIGRRNVLMARQLLWKNGVLIKGEALGGTEARTVALSIQDGRLRITSGRDQLTDL